ncbi:tRNA (guanine37-N1)-methyltransferase [Hydrogenispora ethanolica]|jgi:tRNA (guanine37-N1)-methyltransferase|uniref:tRNA (guanine-N(1)-)-methyltransferase n=1 Tax=Hydrogenispora ethanolica TaxID=1082276 RepID=A0A4R1QK23_HYDET|nr:tRNA (guanosine(37)-N1)-methyltransferase TrmD [Hydrogenispora ethanolica]TCL53916.1 tRNA (guanine37-N1)-methyltransferase [Hydrogenispora ethanolica]
MLIQILTLFPEMFDGPFNCSILKRAQEQNLVEFRYHNFRDFTTDKHRMVDDSPYGGGSGMVLKPEPIYRCLQAVKKDRPLAKTILMTPQGAVFDQKLARQLSAEEHLIFICGHYEGFDERIRQWADFELSIGDYVLTGGELAVMVVCDALVRLIPGALGSDESAVRDSFTGSLLDFPQYTRPVEFEGSAVPELLLSGHHAKIEAWRREQAIVRTAQRRPDLLKDANLTEAEQRFLMEKYNIKP